MASATPSGPASARARASAARASAHDLDLAGEAQLVAERGERGRGQRPRVWARVVTTRVAERQQRAQHRGGVLVVEDRQAGDEAAAGDELRQRLGQRRQAAGVVRAVEDRVRRAASTTSKRPGTSVDAAAARAARQLRGRAVAEVGLVRPRGPSAKLRRWKAPRARSSTRGVVGGLDERGAALARGRLRQRSRVRVGPAPSTSVAAGRTTSSFSAAMSAIVGPEPAGVLEPDVGQHLRPARR